MTEGSRTSDDQTETTPGTLVVGAFLTLDGVMQAPGDPDEDRDGGFEFGGWVVNYWNDRMQEVLNDQFAEVDSLLLGRKTYEIFAAHWPNVDTEDDPVGTKLNSMPKYVISRTLDEVEWNNSTLLSGDVAEAVANLKEDHEDVILVQGSQNLIQTLLAYDLVDAFWIWVLPLVLGEGKRLFGDGTVPTGLELTYADTPSTGVQLLRYERAGEIDYGSFALEES